MAYRLSLEARRIAYGEAALVSRGPQIAKIIGFNACELEFSCGSYHQKDPIVLRVTFASVGEGLDVRTFAAQNFLSTWTNASLPPPDDAPTRVPCSIVPTSVTADSIDVYCTQEQFCVGKVLSGAFDALYQDLPVVAVYNRAGLPMEPFSVNITAASPLPKGGVQLWP